jgi:hypothetical protein
MGKQNAESVPNLHTFGADTDRFKHSFIGVIAPNPGPGEYTISKADRLVAKENPKSFANVFKYVFLLNPSVCCYSISW